MFLRRFGPILALPAIIVVMFLAPAAAQPDDEAGFFPVTDAMLENPAPDDWLMWRRTQNGWGYSPLDQVNRDNVGHLQLAWSRALAPGAQEGTPLAYGGVLFMPNPKEHLQAIDAVTGDLLWEYPPRHPGGRPRDHGRPYRQQPERRHLRQDDHRYEQRRLRLCPRRRDRRAGLGDADLRLPGAPGPAFLRSHRRQRQGHLGTELPASSRAGFVRHRRARRRNRRGAVADATGSPRRGSRATRPGAACLTKSGCTSAPGWSRATTPTST